MASGKRLPLRRHDDNASATTPEAARGYYGMSEVAGYSFAPRPD